MVDESGVVGVAVSRLPQRLGLEPSAIPAMIASARNEVVAVGDRLWPAAVLEDLGKTIRKHVAEHHRTKPLDRGAPVNDLRTKARVPEALFDHVLGALVESRKLTSDAGVIRQPGFSAGLSGAEEKVAQAALAELSAAGGEPPTVGEMTPRLGPALGNVMRFLERTGAVIQVEPGRYYTKESLAAVLDRLKAAMPEPREYTPAELREALGTSRKFLIPLLEYCDRQGLTIRGEAGRIWRGR
jgi:selenocysteine-specific elongation factor